MLVVDKNISNLSHGDESLMKYVPHYGQSFDFTHVSHCTYESMTLNFEAFWVIDQDQTPRDASSDFHCLHT